MTAPGHAPQASDDIATYYDRNTRRFLRFGGGGASRSIHRQLWGPGVTSAREASEHVNVELGNAIERMRLPASFALVDFGCGVGGTLFALARRFERARLTGVTISRRQHALACRARDALGLEGRCDIVSGDFERTALGLRADVVIAVEAFAHARSRAAFFANAARHLVRGGWLVIVDDFIAGETEAGDMTGQRQREIWAFRQGWRLPDLGTVDECIALAQAAGFALDESRDLSRLIRLDRPRERFIASFSPALDRLGLGRRPFFGNLIGGGALTRGLANGTFEHRWLGLRLESDKPSL